MLCISLKGRTIAPFFDFILKLLKIKFPFNRFESTQRIKVHQMTGNNTEKQFLKYSLFLISELLIIGFCATAYGEWLSGIGTGVMHVNVRGDQEVQTSLLGPIKFDVDLEPGYVGDLMKSAVGLRGYFTDRKWMIQYSGGLLVLEDDDAGATLADGSPVRGKINFERTTGELTVGYQVYRKPSFIFEVHGGVRYIRDEVSLDIASGSTELQEDVDEEWTDALAGVSAYVRFTDRWIWSNKFNAGFGESEETYFVSTELTCRFHKYWSSSLYGQYMSVEFESGSEGDSDWYSYDVGELGAGINLDFHW